MNTAEKKIEQIKKAKIRAYSLAEIEERGFIPWAKNGRTIRKVIEIDKRGANLLKAKVVGAATQRRYLIEGAAIIKYLLAHGPSLIATVRKSKTNGRKGNTEVSERARPQDGARKKLHQADQ